MGYESSRYATSEEQAILSRLAEAERREDDPWIRARLDEGVELIRKLIDARNQSADFDVIQDHDPSGCGFSPDPDFTDG